MMQALRTFARILARHWPALIAWFLAGEAVHRGLVQLAGFVGGHTTLGGILILPVAVAARLVAYVAMYLTVRPSLPHAQPPEEGGMREFGSALLAAILPFFLFYAAWGMLDADQTEFFRIAAGIALADAGYQADAVGDRGGLIGVGVLPVAVLIVALGVRLVLSARSGRWSAWMIVVGVYVEMLWTFMLFTLVGQWWNRVLSWWSDRSGAHWFQGIGDWLALHAAPVAVVWEPALWVGGILVVSVIIPAAWLTVAGVIYGTEFTEVLPRVMREGIAVPGVFRGIMRNLTERLEGLWAAVAAVWRGGPLIFGALILVYAAWALLDQLVTRGVLGVIGGHDTAFWVAFLPLILVGVAAFMEPLRVAIIATAYESVFARPGAGLEAAGADIDSEVEREADDLLVAGADVQPERAGSIRGDDIDGEQDVRA